MFKTLIFLPYIINCQSYGTNKTDDKCWHKTKTCNVISDFLLLLTNTPDTWYTAHDIYPKLTCLPTPDPLTSPDTISSSPTRSVCSTWQNMNFCWITLAAVIRDIRARELISIIFSGILSRNLKSFFEK